MNSTIRLFHALPIDNKGFHSQTFWSVLIPSIRELLNTTLKNGFVFSPQVCANYDDEELLKLAKDVESELCFTGKQVNSSFHKSWEKVRTASIEQLVTEQICHYLTTYGMQNLGLFDENVMFIPDEALEVPDLEIQLMVIKGYTKDELRQKLMEILLSGIALKRETIDDVVDVAAFVGIEPDDVELTQNREVKIRLYDNLGFIPKEPTEFLRYVIFMATGNTLLIKSPGVMKAIRDINQEGIQDLFMKYERDIGIERLAEIFYRFKPLFLAFRSTRYLKTTINKIRKLAVKNHQPMHADYLNTITSRLGKGVGLDMDRFDRALEQVNVFRKVRLAYALKYRTKDVESILYRVRNGKSFVKDFAFEDKTAAAFTLDHVLDSIAQDVSVNVRGKRIYIPDYINYALPTTEKQFTGEFPSGTNVIVEKDMIFGVYWKNVNYQQIDLDLSLMNLGGDKFGWDGFYRSEGANILFSGDVTNAPNGASELFYVKKQKEESYLVNLNYFNYREDVPVPYKIMVAHESVNKLKHNYMVDPNNMVAVANSKIDEHQLILGFVKTSKECSRFYFVETALGNSRTSLYSPQTRKALEYLFNYYTDTIGLKDVFVKAGAIMVSKDEYDVVGCDIDLSPENLARDTIIKLLTKV